MTTFRICSKCGRRELCDDSNIVAPWWCDVCCPTVPAQSPTDRTEYRTAFCHKCRVVKVFMLDGSQEFEQTADRRDRMKRWGQEPCGPKDVIAKCEVCCEIRPFHPVDQIIRPA